MRSLWRLPGFGRLALAYSLNELVWFVGTLTLSLLVYRRTGSALGTAAFFVCSQGVPALVAPVIVGRLDRSSPRRLLPTLYWTEAVLFALLAWLVHRFALGTVLALVVVDGVIALTARSLASGARTELLKPVDLVREGGALQNMLFSAAYLVGPALAGGIAAVGGTVAALLVGCGMFALMGLSLVSRTIPSTIVHDGPERGRLRGAVRYARGHPTIGRLLGLQGLGWMIFSIPTPIEVVLAIHTLHAGSVGYGLLMSAWGGGAVVGSLGYARWRRAPVRLLLVAASIGLAAGFATMAVAGILVVALVGAAAAGIGNGVGSAALITELMEITPQSWTAMVSSLSQSIGVLAPGAGIALGGILTAIVEVRTTFAIAAAGCLLVTAISLWLLTPARLAGPGGGAGDDPAEASPGVSGDAEPAGIDAIPVGPGADTATLA